MEVRVVCATNRELEHEIETGSFRADLFYRINVVNLRLPRLRDRSHDIPMLVQYFLDYYNEKYNCRALLPSSHTLSLLERYHWPGNIRELENLIKRYVILGSEETITSELLNHREEHFDPEIPTADAPIALKKVTRQAVRELERRIIFKVLQANNWNRKKAARSLNISYRALLYKIRDAGLGSMGSAAKTDTAASAD